MLEKAKAKLAKLDNLSHIFDELEKRIITMEARLNVNDGIDQTDRPEGKRTKPAIKSIGSQSGTRSTGAILAAGAAVSEKQSQTTAEGGRAWQASGRRRPGNWLMPG